MGFFGFACGLRRSEAEVVWAIGNALLVAWGWSFEPRGRRVTAGGGNDRGKQTEND